VIKRKVPRPTDAELTILRVLWQAGPCSVREVFNRLNEDKKLKIGYTTVLKVMQIMFEKGLVDRDESQRPQIYRTRLAQEQTQRQMIRELVDKVFDGSAKKLVMQAIADKTASDEELAQIEQLLDKIEGSEK
jgi:BlaI family transcriptional regulator, penicillinase repressor